MPLLTSHRELIAASAAVLALVIVLPAIVLAILHTQRSWRLSRMFAALPGSARKRLLRQPSLLERRATLRHVGYLHCEFDTGHSTENAGARLKLCSSLRRALVRVVLAQGGTLDFQSAHSLCAYWNAPLKDAQHALHACAAAARMQEIVAAYNRFPLADRAQAMQVHLAIGVATGEAAAGIVGEDYLVEGEPVRRAAMLAGACCRLGYDVLADENTRQAANLAFLPLRETLDEANAPALYALLGGPITHGSPMLRAVETFHRRIFAAADNGDWAAAAALIAQARRLSGASKRYYDRLETQVERARRKLTPSPVQKAA